MSAGLATVRSNWTSFRRSVPPWGWGVFWIGLAVLYPYITDSVDLPIIGGHDDLLDASIQTLGYIIMALGLNIVVGFAGLLDLGYVAFYAIGAFVIGWFGSQQFPDINGGKGIHILVQSQSAISHQPIPGIHINFFFVIFIAAFFTAIWGMILGAPTLRLRGDYLAIVTLAFGEIVPRVFENSTSGFFGIGSVDFSNGRQGITPIDKINFPWTTDTFKYPLELKPAYYVALGMVLFTVFILCMIIIGGMGNISGVILGAVFLSLVNRDLLPQINTYPGKIGLNFDVTSINFGIFGFLLLVMMVLRPEGFLPSTRRKIELHEAEIEGEEAAPGGAMTPEMYEVRHE